MIKKPISVAFDSHMHILPLSHICLSAYLSFVEQNKMEESVAVASAPDYIFKDVLQNRSSVTNMLSIMENPCAQMLMLMEDDLSASFKSPKVIEEIENHEKLKKILRPVISVAEKVGLKEISSHPIINNVSKHIDPILTKEGLNILDTTFDYLVLTPLLMDFNLPDKIPATYYNRPPKHDTFNQANDLLEGIKEYRQQRPNGHLIVRPYFGINPRYWTIDQINDLLQTHFGKFSANEKDILNTWNKIPKRNINKKHPYKNAFAGIKVYPPLGFDPYPENPDEHEKIDLIFSFCQKKGIPITTHCDDQGFRIISQEDSFKFTSPERWEKVLKDYPDLYLNIGHFGKQYYKGLKYINESSWQEKIIELMKKYPHVYADISFDGVDSEYFNDLNAIIAKSPNNEIIQDRLLFGTDWPLCLSKIESAALYWDNFLSSSLTQELKIKMISTNPKQFHFRSI